MVDQVIYPIQLFSTTTKDEDDAQLVGCLALYNYETFEIQQVPLTAIARIAIIADPEHPQTTPETESPDWLRIFLHGWNDDFWTNSQKLICLRLISIRDTSQIEFDKKSRWGFKLSGIFG